MKNKTAIISLIVFISLTLTVILTSVSNKNTEKEDLINLEKKRIENAENMILKLKESKERNYNEAQKNITNPEHLKEFVSDLNSTHAESILFWEKKIKDAKQKIQAQQ